MGIAALGVATSIGAVAAAGSALVRADRRRESDDGAGELGMPDDLVHHEIATSDGGRVHAVERGEGRPIVLLHGVTLTHEIWPYQLRSLAGSGHRVIAVDQRSHGHSTAGSTGTSLDAMVRDLGEVLETLDLRGVVLVGHSMGSMVAIDFTARLHAVAKRRVAALALIGATAHAPAVTRRLAVAAGAFELGTKAMHSRSMTLLPPGDLGYLMARWAFGVRPDQHQVDLTRDISGAMSPLRFGELIPSILGFDDRNLLPRIDVPALVTIGPVDRILPPSCHRLLAARIPSVRRLELPGCGHMPMLERHEELDSALIELSASLPAMARAA